MTAAIETTELSKRYGRHLALDRLTLQVEQGEIFGFLGPNGAGKSTTIRTLLDLIRPSGGSARILGFDCQSESLQVRANVGYLPGDLRLYSGITGEDTLSLFAELRGGEVDREQGRALAKQLDLDLDRHANTYSKGNRQKLGLVLALQSRPRVLLLDEPTSGLDPIAQHAVWDILRREADRGTTVFFSSHVMSEVEQICERVAILREGRLVAVEPLSELKGRSVRHVAVTFAGAAPAPGVIAGAGISELQRGHDNAEYEVTGEFDAFLKQLAEYHVLDLRTEQPTLDEVLLSYYRASGALR